jgi:hypothetical protein
LKGLHLRRYRKGYEKGWRKEYKNRNNGDQTEQHPLGRVFLLRYGSRTDIVQLRDVNRQHTPNKGEEVNRKRKEDKHEEDMIISMLRSICILEEPNCYKGGQE